MVKKTINKRLYRMIMATKGQYIAILVIIILGILIFIALSMAANNLKTTLDTYYEETNFADFFVSAHSIPESGLKSIESINGVRSVEGRVSATVPFISENIDERVKVMLISSTPDEKINKIYFIDGEYITDKYKDVMVLSQFAAARGIVPGDEITIQVAGKPVKLHVSALVANPEFIYLMESPDALMTDASKYGAVYVSQELAQSLLGMNGNFNELVIDYDERLIPENDNDTIIESVREDIEKKVDQYGIFRIYHKKDQLSNVVISQKIYGLKTMSSSLPIVFLLVAALILTMMLNRMVKKDRGIIGLFKAIGYSNKEIIIHYTKYALFAGLIGGAIGGIAGLASASGITQIYLQYFNIPMLRVNFDVTYIFIAMLMASVICVVAGLVGTKGILHISPVEAMKAENPKAGKHIFIERIPQIWKRLSFSWKLVSKNIFRSKKRTALVVAGVIFTYSMILFTLSMPAVIDNIMNKYFIDYLKMDYSVSFKRPIDKSAIYDFKAMGEIDLIEGKAEIPVEISNGNLKKTINLLALDKNTAFYGFKDKNDIPVKIPEKGLILTENLANILKVKPGDKVRLKPYSGGTAVYDQVAYVVPQSLGMGVYTNIGSLDNTFMDNNLITGVNIKSKDLGLPRELYKAKNISTVSSSNDIRAMYDESLALIIVAIGFMLAFSGILGFAIVYNVTSVNIGERETEFSTLRVLGFSNKEIFRLILKENNVITVIGILIGIPVGMAMLSYATLAFSTENYSINMEPTNGSIIASAIVTLLFILLAQVATYKKIKKLDFLEALKSRI